MTKVDEADTEKCFACDRRLVRPHSVFTRDKHSDGKKYVVFVGPECCRHVQSAGQAGFQPPKAGSKVVHQRGFGPGRVRGLSGKW